MSASVSCRRRCRCEFRPSPSALPLPVPGSFRLPRPRVDRCWSRTGWRCRFQPPGLSIERYTAVDVPPPAVVPLVGRTLSHDTFAGASHAVPGVGSVGVGVVGVGPPPVVSTARSSASGMPERRLRRCPCIGIVVPPEPAANPTGLPTDGRRQGHSRRRRVHGCELRSDVHAARGYRDVKHVKVHRLPYRCLSGRKDGMLVAVAASEPSCVPVAPPAPSSS